MSLHFLLDLNVARSVGRALAGEGYFWRHAGDAGMEAWPDVRVLRTAADAGEVVVTHDLDCGQLLAFLGVARPSVVIIRWRHLDPTTLGPSLASAVRRHEPDLAAGCLLVLEDAATRLRRLPFAQGGEG